MTSLDPHSDPAPVARDGGFTLVETLVALAVLAMGLAGLYRALDSGWRGLREAARATEALAVARNLLAALGTETPLATGRRTGTTPGGVRWEVDVGPYVPPGATAARATPSPAAPPPLYAVTVRAGRPASVASAATSYDGVVLETVKLGARP